MKKDILKEFVDKNRSSFDESTPSDAVFAKIQQQINAHSEEKKTKVISLKYWWAAAATLILIVGTILFIQQKKSAEISPLVQNKVVAPHEKVIPTKDVVIQKSTLLAKTDNPPKRTTKNSIGKNYISTRSRKSLLQYKQNSQESVWKKRLGDSLSASDRLATVLEMSKLDNLSNIDIRELVNTMNKDENSNVRLAALDAINNQKNQKEVKPLLLKSVSQQNDPIVQMELLSMLTPHEVKSVKKELIEISHNPLTLDAVRDQAYVALLRSKSNF